MGVLKLKELIMWARYILMILTIVAVSYQICLAQPFFSKEHLMNVGVYYYPEAWPREQWARDIKNIKDFGFEFVHMGEFAWAFMEPEEGQFDLSWLEKVVNLSAQSGLKVILCTPSATPPVWLVEKHPEVLMVDARGRRMEHGSREHACWSVQVYREYVAKIVSELGKRFGNNKTVWGWQIDNELSHYEKGYCYCDFCQTKFRQWLQKKYLSISRLNRDWGNAFWSQMYQDFSQIRIPNEEELVAQRNPHALLDFQRWFAEEAADYIKFQANLLRKYCKGQWITTNFMNMHRDVNPVLSGRDLDIITWTLYPVHGDLNEGSLGFRLGDGVAISYMHDFTRTINGFEGVMELQPGQVNWGLVNPQPYPGAVRMWILRAFAGGAKIVCTYRYRQPLFGAELYHQGIVGPDGLTPTVGGLEYAQAMRDINLLRLNYRANIKKPEAYASRRTALLYNVDNRWDIDNHLQTVRWNTMGHLLKYYKALKSFGCPVDVITEDKTFAEYPFLLAPAYQLVDEGLISRLIEYVRGGGHLILSCRTGQKDRRGQLWERPWANPIYPLIGARISMYDVLPEPFKGTVVAAERKYEWESWAEILEPDTSTNVIARYVDHFYAGRAAATTAKLGKGTVTYIGVESTDGDLEKNLLRSVFTGAGVAIQDFDNQFLVDWRDGFWISTNFTEKEQTAPILDGAIMLVGQQKLKPGEVAIWKDLEK